MTGRLRGAVSGGKSPEGDAPVAEDGVVASKCPGRVVDQCRVRLNARTRITKMNSLEIGVVTSAGLRGVGTGQRSRNGAEYTPRLSSSGGAAAMDRRAVRSRRRDRRARIAWDLRSRKGTVRRWNKGLAGQRARGPLLS